MPGKVGGWALLYISIFLYLYIYELCSFSNLSVTSPTSQLILQPFRRFTYVTTHSPTLPSLYLCHSSFSNPSIASPTSQFILQPFFRFSYVTSSSLNSELCSFSKLSSTSPTSQLILQPFRRFTYVTAHSPTLQLLHLRHSSFSNPSLASPMSQALHLIHLASRSCDVTNISYGIYCTCWREFSEKPKTLWGSHPLLCIWN